MQPKPGVSREDVLFAYEAILGRPPESEWAIDYHLKFPNRKALVEHMLRSREFRLTWIYEQILPFDQVYAGYTPTDLLLFQKFPPYKGPGQAGFVVNFLGVRVRTHFSTPLKAYDGMVEDHPFPSGGLQGETAEFIGSLRAVLAADKTFTMLECGAGYGPWMAITAAAARKIGIDEIRLYGIEGDAGHVEYMREHMADNGIGTDRYTPIHGAVGAAAGTARWQVVDNPADVYGGRPVADEARDVQRTEGARYIDVKVFGVDDVLQREKVWDLVHIDIQGGETDVCRAGIETMNARVRRVVIGTHSRVIDGELLALFHAAGWTLESEKPTIMDWGDGGPIETMVRTDGVQVWRNPRLVGPPAV